MGKKLELTESGTLVINEEFLVKSNINEENKIDFVEAVGGKIALMPRIEAIHAGITKNKVEYSAEKLSGDIDLKSGLYSWTYPYPKPVLKNHDTDSEPLGRIINAQFISESSTGRSALVVIPIIKDQDAIEKILDGRYYTVSIGAETNAAVCSICGTDVVSEGWCGHVRGDKYNVDGKLTECYWQAGDLWFNEISFVNIPADQHAQVVTTGDLVTMECYAENDGSIYDLQASVQDEERILTQENAKLNGLITINDNVKKTKRVQKGGQKTLEKIKELEAKIEAMAAEHKEQLETLQAQLDEANKKIAEHEAQTKELTDKNQELADKNEELSTSLESTVSEKDNISAQLLTSQEENKTLMQENANLSTEIHKELVERVVDMKFALGKVADREASVAEHIVRSPQSLRDTLYDLKGELQSGGVFMVEKVPNPGAPRKDKQELKDGKQPEVTNEDVLYGLLSGNKRK